MSIKNDLQELIEAGIINQDTANRIDAFYTDKQKSSPNRLLLIFGVIGSLLVGLGILLIIAHNWDELPRSIKTCFAFLPLLIGQGACLYSLVQEKDTPTWRESSSTFLSLSIGASIALVGQVYNLPGNLYSFLLTWSLLCLPVIYIMRSSVASIIYISLISYLQHHSNNADFYIYWGLLLAVFPYYFYLIRQQSDSNFTNIHHWLIALSLCFGLSLSIDRDYAFIFPAYFSLFGAFYMVGNSSFLQHKKIINNSYKIIGAIGSSILLIVFNTQLVWKELAKEIRIEKIWTTPELMATMVTSLIALGLLVFTLKTQPLKNVKPLSFAFIFFLIFFGLEVNSPIPIWFMNAFVLLLSILTINGGIERDRIITVNWGLLLLMSLILIRFFDVEMSFTVRGIIFLLLGLGFFLVNYWVFKKRRINE